MLPPSDSLLHQSHKLAEVIASLQNGVTSSSPPPPPYALRVPLDPAPEDTLSNVDAEDDPLWEPSHQPINIHIDASISVLGNGNAVMIPSMTAHQGSSVETEQSLSTTSTHQSAQRHRQTKLTELATSIIAALGDSEQLAHSEFGSHNPIKMSINTGIKIEGSRNAIWVGVPGRPPRRNVPNKSANDQTSTRKRRAQSVCIRSCSFNYLACLT